MVVCRDELTADFQQYYNLDLNQIGKTFSVMHAAVLATQLPTNSRTFAKEWPEMTWSEDTYLLSRLEHLMRIQIWSQSKDAQKGRNFPEPLDTPGKTKRMQERLENTNIHELDKALLGGE